MLFNNYGNCFIKPLTIHLVCFRAIKRVIFYSVNKMGMRPDGLRERMPLSTSQALQIAGRAGRYGTRYEEGEVTTYFHKDLPKLMEIVSAERPAIEVRAAVVLAAIVADRVL